MHVNAHALARYAALCQEAGIVPIVEPEVLMDGDHTIDRSEQVTGDVLAAVFAELRTQRVELEGMLLKPNMVLSGYDCPEQASDEEVAERTLRCLRRHVPAAVPGIVFLSGGQSDEDATNRLNLMNRHGPAALADQLLLRPRPAGRGAGDVARRARQRRGRAAPVSPSRPLHRRRAPRRVLRGDGARARAIALSAAAAEAEISSWIAGWAQRTPTSSRSASRIEISYGELERRVARLAGALAGRAGIAEGDRVAYLGQTRPSCSTCCSRARASARSSSR